MIHADIQAFNAAEGNTNEEKAIFQKLAALIDIHLPEAESKVWHRHPVWFIDKNPIVGYVKQKAGIRLMFWSGASFDDDRLGHWGARFKDASVYYNSLEEIDEELVIDWLKKSRDIQWNYRDLVKKKGQLDRLK